MYLWSCPHVNVTGPYSCKSKLVQAVAWHHQATGHCLSQCWPSSISPYGVTDPQWVNCLKCSHGGILWPFFISLSINLISLSCLGSPSIFLFSSQVDPAMFQTWVPWGRCPAYVGGVLVTLSDRLFPSVPVSLHHRCVWRGRRTAELASGWHAATLQLPVTAYEWTCHT